MSFSLMALRLISEAARETRIATHFVGFKVRPEAFLNLSKSLAQMSRPLKSFKAGPMSSAQAYTAASPGLHM